MKKMNLFLYLIYVFIKLLIKHVFKIGKPSVYISGKISGLRYAEVFKKFTFAEKELRFDGYFVVNPIRLAPQNTEWLSAMKIDVCLMSLCEKICVLPDWSYSKGAMIEYEISQEIGLKKMRYSEHYSLSKEMTQGKMIVIKIEKLD